jgi:PST family polysaccharide transporter
MLILARMLGPGDFGRAAIAVIYISFLQLFLDQGFMTALIQRKDLDPRHLDAVFWMDQALSVLLVTVSVVLSKWWAENNHAPDVATVISVLSLSIPIQGLAAVQTALLRRQMDFRSLSIRSNAAVVVSGLVGTGLAFAGFRVWALVGQQLVRDSVALVLLWKFSPWRPGFAFSWKHLRDLTSFSVSNFIAQLALFGEAQASSILLGLMFGPIAVGLYRLADRVTGSVVTMATSSIQAVALPEFSRLQDEPEKLKKSVLTCVRLSAVVSLPVLAGLAAVSGPLTATIGPEWVRAAGAVRILSVLGMCSVLAFFTGPLLQALFLVRKLAILEWARVGVGSAVLVVAGALVRNGSATSQVSGIALARLATGAVLVTPVFLWILMRLCNVGFRNLLSALAPAAATAAAAVGSTLIVQWSGWVAGRAPVVALMVESAVCAVSGVMTLFTFDRELREAVVRMVQSKRSREAVALELR